MLLNPATPTHLILVPHLLLAWVTANAPRYHLESLKQMKFFDDNTRSWWTPITGGANVPALNDLLAPHNITLGERILQGVANLGEHKVTVRGRKLPGGERGYHKAAGAATLCRPSCYVDKVASPVS